MKHMEKNKKLSLTLDDEFIYFCKLNNIDDVEKKAKEVFQKGFTMVKFGDQPFIVEGKEKCNTKVVTSPRPEPMSAPQPKIIKKENNSIYDE